MAKGIMDFLRGGSMNTWHPVKGVDTTTSGYWLNWRAILCYIWLLTSSAMAFYLIKKYERRNKLRSGNRDEEGDDDNDDGFVVYDDDIWKPCLKGINPVWLMAFRLFALFVLLFIIILNTMVGKGTTFHYYTEWTFLLLIIYFVFGSLLSMCGCYHHHINPENRRHPREVVGFWGYIFKIVFQMVAGAVVLTDCLFWFIIVPFLVKEDNYSLGFLTVTLHTINVVFLLGDAALNSLRFPWFRIAYFVLWTCIYVVFEWIVHARIALWWPYPFLDLSFSLSPLWYLLVALFHVVCYGIFFLFIKLKNFLLLKISLRAG